MKTQYDRIGELISRPGGATSVQIVRAVPSLSIHKRLSVMRLEMGWKIKKLRDGKFTRYIGQPPKAKTPTTVWVKL